MKRTKIVYRAMPKDSIDLSLESDIKKQICLQKDKREKDGYKVSFSS